MAHPPPRKRQRRQVVLSSEDEYDDGESRSASHINGRSSEDNNGRVASTEPAGTLGASSFVFAPHTATSPSRTRKPTQTKLPVSSSPKATTRTGPRSTLQSSTSPEKQLTKRKGSRRQDSAAAINTATTAGTTPTNSPAKDTEKTRSLRTFFRPATEEQRWDRANRSLPQVSKSKLTEQQQQPEWEEEEDLIEDDGVDEIFESFMGNGRDNGPEKDNGAARGRREVAGNNIKDGQAEIPVRTAKKFVLPTSNDTRSVSASGREDGGRPALLSEPTRPEDSSRPWPEEFAPVNMEELAVHKKKVADVRSWLVDVFSGKSRRRILVLRGPAGSGKTTTVSLLSKELEYGIVEWRNVAATEYSTPGYMSMGAQFDDFLGRTDKFNTLETDNMREHHVNIQRSGTSDAQRRVILVEEFPTSLSQGSSGLAAFRTVLQRYLAAAVPALGIDKRLTKPNLSSSPPIIIVVSETLLGAGSSWADNFTVHRLLGPEISNHPGVSIIEFNPVAPTYISKALDLVLKKEARRSKRRRIPGPSVLKKISETGDIRSAISSLEFLCLRGDDTGGNEGWSGTLASRMKRPGKKGALPTGMENESLEMITQREASIGIFHAVGRVMYNKREDPSVSGSEEGANISYPPPHLQEHARPKESQVSIDDLMNETGTDIQTFIAALHENYVLSCNGSTFPDSLEGCVSWLSDTDILNPESRRGYRTSRGGVGSARPSFPGYGGSIDVLRQEEISFQTAVRGLLFSLPYPVKRRAVPGYRAGDAYKMFFPTSLRLWRENEEIEGLLDIWIRRLSTSPSTGSSNLNTRQGGVESWKNRFSSSLPSNDENAGDESTPAAAARAMISRDEVLLERLPYLSKISKDPSDLKQLEKLTKFHGTVNPSDDPADEDPDSLDAPAVVEPWATDRPPISPKKRRPQKRVTDDFSPKPVEDVVDKLVLSDDDIED